MSKKAILFALALFSLFAFASLSSAYYYAPQGYYDSYSYHSSRAEGYYGAPPSVSTTDYNRYTTEHMLPDGSMEKSTHYVTTKRESPNYYGSYRTYGYPAYNTYYNNYRNYYDSYNYDDYYPWYQKYWENDNQRYGMYGNYYPRHYF